MSRPPHARDLLLKLIVALLLAAVLAWALPSESTPADGGKARPMYLERVWCEPTREVRWVRCYLGHWPPDRAGAASPLFPGWLTLADRVLIALALPPDRTTADGPAEPYADPSP